MLKVNRIREDRDNVISGLKKRGWNDENLTILDQVISLDDERKSTQAANDKLLSEVKSFSAQIGEMFKSGKSDEANQMKAQVSEIKSKASENENHMRDVITSLNDLLYQIPNIPHSLVKEGASEEDNEIVNEQSDNIPELFDGAFPHWELMEKYNLVDLKLGVKITGSGFPVYRGKGAKLQRALIQYFLDEAITAGYEEFIPPFLVNADSAMGTGSLPDKEGQMYYCEKDNLYLIPTAEIPVTNVYRDVLLKEGDFPVKMTAYTPCFRREAGSYGADVKGLNRVHQFDKVEIVEITKPENSYDVLDRMVSHVSRLLESMELPYRILRLCGGDLTFTSAMTYDFEVFSAAQKRWLEVSSVSNFETYQSNRLKLRYKDNNGKSHLAHTLNGSALALARIFAAILENNQTANGINIPKVLIPYTGFNTIE